MEFSEMAIGINPICAEIIAKEIPNIGDVQEILWRFASLPGDWLQEQHRAQIEAQGRIRGDGRIYATPEPKDMILFVCGGLGGLHALGLHSFGSSLAQTKPIAATAPAVHSNVA